MKIFSYKCSHCKRKIKTSFLFLLYYNLSIRFKSDNLFWCKNCIKEVFGE